MLALIQRCIPFLAIFLALNLVNLAVVPDYAEARSKSGGRSFSSPAPNRPSQQMAPNQQFGQKQQAQPGGFGRGLMGGLLGGAIGGLLLGSLFGASGSGMGILPIILLGVAGYFLYKRFVKRPSSGPSSGYQSPTSMFRGTPTSFGGGSAPPVPPAPPAPGFISVDQGLAQIRLNDPGFDDKYFLEVASDVFFKVQAGWMHREIDSYRHLLGNQLAAEYESHLAQMKAQGRINKLESIAIRKVEITAAGSDNGEDFVTVLFTANLLDYTVDDKTGTLIEGSMTEPVKFAEKWTWARPIRTESWKLEGVEVVED